MSDFEKSINASDLIDWIMCAFPDWCVGDVRAIVDHVNEMPSAQPEIIRCRECKHRDPEDKKCDCGHDIVWNLPRQDDWFCADAKRRTDGTE